MSMGKSASITIEVFPDPTSTCEDPVVNLNNYIGTGISNKNMLVDSADGITLGIKAHHRFDGDACEATRDGDRAVYTAPTGGDGGGLIYWNYDFVYDFGSAITAPLTALYGIRVRLDFDPADGDVANGDWYQMEYAIDSNLESSGPQGGGSQNMGFAWFGPPSSGGSIAGDFDQGPPSYAKWSGTENHMTIDPAAEGRYDVEVEIFELSSGDVIVSAAMYVLVSDGALVPPSCAVTEPAAPAQCPEDPPADDNTGKKAKSVKDASTAGSASKGTVSASVVAAVCGVVVVVAAAMVVAVKRSRRAHVAQDHVKDFEAQDFEQDF
jgi:hypothetical protein